MQNLRHRLQLVVILGCLTWGGYQITSAALAEPGNVPENQADTTTSTTDQDIEKLYANLPAGVARAVPSVVATLQIDNNQKQGSVASGVIINGEQILTAGHNVEGDQGLDCSRTSVIAPGMLTNAAVSSDSVTHASVSYGKTSDLALLTIRSSQNFSSLPDMRIAGRLPEKGDKVYFINFQPTADGMARSPAAQTTAEALKDYSKPAIFAGTVLGTTKHGLAIATGNGDNYGIGAPDTMIRKGASGGAIVNTGGELVGLSVSSQSLQANRTAASIAKEFQIVLNDAGQQYQIANMQPIGAGLIKRLQTSMISCASSTTTSTR